MRIDVLSGETTKVRRKKIVPQHQFIKQSMDTTSLKIDSETMNRREAAAAGDFSGGHWNKAQREALEIAFKQGKLMVEEESDEASALISPRGMVTSPRHRRAGNDSEPVRPQGSVIKSPRHRSPTEKPSETKKEVPTRKDAPKKWQDPSDLNFIKLKKWLLAAGCPKSDVDGAMNKAQLLKLVPRYRTTQGQ